MQMREKIRKEGMVSSIKIFETKEELWKKYKRTGELISSQHY